MEPNYDAQEKELLNKLAEVRAAKEKAAKERAESEPVTIYVTSTDPHNTYLEHKFNQKLLDLFHKVPSAYWQSYNRLHRISTKDFNTFKALVDETDNFTIMYQGKTKEKLEGFFATPAWHVTLEKNWINVIPGPFTERRLKHTPGSSWDTQRELWRIPKSEVVELLNNLPKDQEILFDPDVQEFIRNFEDTKKKLDEIATQTVNESFKHLDLNGKHLYDFQSVGAAFIDAAGSGLIADEMGLGKTWQAIALAVKNNWKTLVICPASLKQNWTREIFELTGETPLVLSGATPTRFDLIKIVKHEGLFTIINYDILSRKVEYEDQTVFEWAENLVTFGQFDLIACDEVHYIKNVDSNRSKAVRILSKAPHKLALSGTPMLNYLHELWPTLNFIAPTVFSSYETFLRQYTLDGKKARDPKELRSMLKSYMIRRLKKDVVKELPPINRIYSYRELSPKAHKLYHKVLAGVFDAVADYSANGQGDAKKVTNILVQIQRLKQVCAIDKVDYTADLAQDSYEQTDEESPRKVIIFTQFKATAYKIWQRLADDGALSFVRRTATDFVTEDIDTRNNLIKQFQEDPDIKYIVATEKTMREGHNATAAGHVIFNDLFWTPAAHEQAEGRAYGRLSNLHTINSSYVVTDMEGKSIEEMILQLLNLKSSIIGNTIENLNEERNIGMDLINMLKNMRGIR